MADISKVDTPTIKDLYAKLESLSCASQVIAQLLSSANIDFSTARIKTRILY